MQQKNDFVGALLKEVEMTSHYAGNPSIDTIYFGGGTPSLLTEHELNSILDAVYEKFTVHPKAEITLEANPDDIHMPILRQWKKNGINRLSIGIQSFYEADLQWMNRAHNHEQAKTCVPDAQEAGFSNISIDLIYGTPTLSDEQWEQNVAQALTLGIPHLSCYALTVEPSTALKHLIDKQKMQDVDPDQQARQFLQLVNWLRVAGYEHYEISNFALPGSRSKHNSAYWQGKPYYGFGPSAHSFDGKLTRSWNVSNNALYIKNIHGNEPVSEHEILSPVQQHNEYIMTALRTMEGIDLAFVSHAFGTEAGNRILAIAAPHLGDTLVLTHDHLQLTDRGNLFADGLAADFFQD